MATMREDFFDKVSTGAKWDVGVSINRTNGVPLDVYSVFQTTEELNNYVSGVFSYPGQVLALVKENETIIYYLDQNKALKPVGTIPVGDGKTIEVVDGKIQLKASDTQIVPEGEEEAVINTGAVLTLQADGTLKWVKPDTSTAEGQAQAISDLQGRTTKLESDVAALGSAFEFKGTATSISEDLKHIYNNGEPIENINAGDVYQIGDKEYAYNGEVFVELGFNVDLTGYATETYVDQAESDAVATAVGTDEDTADSNTIKGAKKYAEAKATAAETAAKEYTDDEIEKLNIGQYATTEALNGVKATAEAAATQTSVDTLTGIVNGHTTSIEGNTSSINELSGKVGTLETDNTTNKANIQANTDNIATLTTLANENKTGLSTLSGTVSQHTTDIGKNASDIAALTTRVGTAEGSITSLTTGLENANTEIGKKANSADVYTKTEIGELGGKTVITLIEEAKTAATYNDTQVKADIKTNADAIAILNGVTAEDATGDSGKSVRVIASEEVAKVVAGAPEDLDTLKELADFLQGDGADAVGLVNTVNANTTAISAINNAETGILAQSKGYTDSIVAALAKADGTSIEEKTLEDGSKVLSVKEVSTDLLVNGETELVLFGGNANTVSN